MENNDKPTLYVVNYAHQLTDKQKAQISAWLNDDYEILEVWNQATFDLAQDLLPQVELLVHNSFDEKSAWGKVPFIIVPPALSSAALIAAAIIHGLSGGFPSMVRLKAKQGIVVEYELAEIINLGSVRQISRTDR